MNAQANAARNTIADAVCAADFRLWFQRRRARRVIDELIPRLPTREALKAEGFERCEMRLNQEVKAVIVVGFFTAFFWELCIGIAVTICLRLIFRDDAKAKLIQQARGA